MQGSSYVGYDFPVTGEARTALSVLSLGNFDSVGHEIVHCTKSNVRKMLKTWEASIGSKWALVLFEKDLI